MPKPVNLKSLHEQSNVKLRSSFESLKYVPRFFREIVSISGSLFWYNSLCRLMAALLPVAILWVGKSIVDEIISLINSSSTDYQLLWIYVGVEFGLVILSDVISRIIALTDGMMGDKYSLESSVLIIRKTKDVELIHLEDPVFYDKLNLARNQTAGRVNLMSNVLSQVQDLITIISLIIGLIYYQPWLIILLIASVIPSFISELKFSSASYSLSRSWTSERRELDYLRFIGANDKTAKEVKLFGLADFIAERFSNLSTKYYLANIKLAKHRTAWGSIFNIVGSLSYYFAYVLIILSTIQKVISLGELTFLSTSFNRLRNSLQGIFSRFTRITESSLYLQDYYDFVDWDLKEHIDEALLPVPTDIKSGIEIKNVRFRYPGSDHDVLKGLNLKIKAGEKIAFVGENGSGKTTLIKLLLRFYDPSEGQILLDGIDIRRFDRDEYQQLFGVIFQDFVQYEFTIGENIAVGKISEIESASSIENAASKSLAKEVVDQFELKYKQQLGKRFKSGKELSGGQWQKIALARAYMKDAKVMVLDEPTSALDARAEYETFQRFIGLTKGKTSVIISHRFSTVRMADRIMVIKDGIIAELGSHETLMQQNGIYAELFNLQAAGYN